MAKSEWLAHFVLQMKIKSNLSVQVTARTAPILERLDNLRLNDFIGVKRGPGCP